MNKNEKISVLIPLFNAEKTIIESLESISKQTYKNLEIVISLNGINEYFNEPGKDNFYPFSTKTLFTMNKNQLWIDQRFKGFLNSKFVMNITPNLRDTAKLIPKYVAIPLPPLNFSHIG